MSVRVDIAETVSATVLPSSSDWTTVDSDDYEKISCSRGRNYLTDEGEPGTASVRLDNRDGTYNPDDTNSSLVPSSYDDDELPTGLDARRWLRIVREPTGGDETIWTGLIESIKPSESHDKTPRVTIRAADVLTLLSKAFSLVAVTECTITLGSVTSGDSIDVQGTTLIADTDFNVGSDDTATATNLATAIDGLSDAAATSSSNVVTATPAGSASYINAENADASMTVEDTGGETLSARIDSILDAVSLSGITITKTGIDQSPDVIPTRYSDRTALHALTELAVGDNGMLYSSRTGEIIFAGRHARPTSSDVLTMVTDDTPPESGETPIRNVKWSFDIRRVKNIIAVTQDGQDDETAEHSGSKSRYGPRDDSFVSLADSATARQSLAQWRRSILFRTRRRLASVSFSGDDPDVTSAVASAIATLDPGDRLLVYRQSGGTSSSGRFYAESVSHNWSKSGTWTTSATCSNARWYGGWRLEIPGASELETTTQIAL